MHVNLILKKKAQFFWLRMIKDVNIDNCCIKCFKADKDNRVYYGSLSSPTVIDVDIDAQDKYIAYYICGISKNFVHKDNTHVAFVPEIGSTVQIDNDKICLKITDAREIHFQDYKPNPIGEFTEKQRACRNWIFANYVKDGMPL